MLIITIIDEAMCTINLVFLSVLWRLLVTMFLLFNYTTTTGRLGHTGV